MFTGYGLSSEVQTFWPSPVLSAVQCPTWTFYIQVRKYNFHRVPFPHHQTLTFRSRATSVFWCFHFTPHTNHLERRNATDGATIFGLLQILQHPYQIRWCHLWWLWRYLGWYLGQRFNGSALLLTNLGNKVCMHTYIDCINGNYRHARLCHWICSSLCYILCETNLWCSIYVYLEMSARIILKVFFMFSVQHTKGIFEVSLLVRIRHLQLNTGLFCGNAEL